MTASARAAARSTPRGGSPSQFHRKSVVALHAADVPFLIGGAYVVEVYAGVSRSTKDFDLYVWPKHVKAALRALARAGYETELTFPHWLAKAKYGEDIVDLIFVPATDCAKSMIPGSNVRAMTSCWVCR